jgi:hypothetical protein
MKSNRVVFSLLLLIASLSVSGQVYKFDHLIRYHYNNNPTVRGVHFNTDDFSYSMHLMGYGAAMTAYISDQQAGFTHQYDVKNIGNSNSNPTFVFVYKHSIKHNQNLTLKEYEINTLHHDDAGTTVGIKLFKNSKRKTPAQEALLVIKPYSANTIPALKFMLFDTVGNHLDVQYETNAVMHYAEFVQSGYLFKWYLDEISKVSISIPKPFKIILRS